MFEFFWAFMGLPLLLLLVFAVPLIGAAFSVFTPDNREGSGGVWMAGFGLTAILAGLMGFWNPGEPGSDSNISALHNLMQTVSWRGALYFALTYVGVGVLYSFPAAWMYFKDAIREVETTWNNWQNMTLASFSRQTDTIPLMTAQGTSTRHDIHSILGKVTQEPLKAFSEMEISLIVAEFNKSVEESSVIPASRVEHKLTDWLGTIGVEFLNRTRNRGLFSTSLPDGILQQPDYTLNKLTLAGYLSYWIACWPGCVLSNLCHDFLRHLLDWFVAKFHGIYASLLEAAKNAVRSTS